MMLDQTVSPITVVPGRSDQLVYAIGDVHGRLDLLNHLLAAIEDDSAGEPYALIFLGDYIDRGPESAGVIDRLVALTSTSGSWVGALAGNHERFLLNFLETPALGPPWLDYGGRSTLSSYGVTAPRLRTDAADWSRAARDLREAMPAPHLNILQSLALAYEWGGFLFVHAGVRPGIPLDQQSTADLTCIRTPFLDAKNPAPSRIVIFGHTPAEEVWAKGGKICVDTGAYATGTLSALRILQNDFAVLNSRGERTPLDISAL